TLLEIIEIIIVSTLSIFGHYSKKRKKTALYVNIAALIGWWKETQR
ncbi:12979_t:CDS:1, partial [Dentiscutata heterogama]